MRPWVALTLTIAIWLFAAAVSSFLVFGFQIDFYTHFCSLPISISHGVFGIIVAFVTLGIIFITSLWTFCFTRRFFKDQSVIAGESVYASKKKRLFGIFGSMLLIYGICFVPGVLYFLVSLFINASLWFNAVATLCFLFITIASPFIQSYFRPEIKSFFVSRCPHHICIFC